MLDFSLFYPLTAVAASENRLVRIKIRYTFIDRACRCLDGSVGLWSGLDLW